MQQPVSKRNPRKLNRPRDIQSTDSRTSSLDGGIPLPQPTKPDPQPPPDPKQTTATGSASRRRRPRKLAGTDPAQRGNDRPDVTREIRKLEVRVQGIETQVQEIRRRGESTSTSRTGSKGARRRARRNKSAGPANATSDETGAESGTAGEGDVDVSATAREKEASSGEDGGRQLVVVRKPDADETADDGVEDIPYQPAPKPQQQQQQQQQQLQRAITVSGSYHIPLPATVSDRDVRAVQRGLTGVQNIARRVLEDVDNTAPAAAPYDEVTRMVQATRSGSGWSAWLGAYSVSVARLVRGGDFRAAMEGPAVGARPSVRWAGVEPGERRRRPPRKLRVGRGEGEDGGLDGKGAESLLAWM
jgi:hypothetical protein